MTTLMEIPHSPSDLTSDWLTRALQHGKVIGEGKVSTFESIEAGNGFYGQIVRLALTYDPPGVDGPRTMIAKFSSANPEMRLRPETKASYEHEVRFYQEIARDSHLPVPVCYYADIDSNSGWHILLLEDLAPAKSGSRVKGCSQNEARIAIHNIARFHACWWENPGLDKLSWLVEKPGTFKPADVVYFREKLWPVFLRKAGKTLPVELMKTGQFLSEHWIRIALRIFTEKPQTLIHSDYHSENMMFGAEGEKAFYVIDWQFVKRGRGIWDVAYFLSQSMQPEDRQAIEMNLLHDYLQILYDNGVRNYSFDDAMNDYKMCIVHRFGNLISTIAAMPFTEEQIRMHINVLLPRIVSAMLDHECLSLTDNFS
jgi:hypothetical protein